jgi:hypothetical protein
MSDITKIWITKYALTGGIHEAQARIRADGYCQEVDAEGNVVPLHKGGFWGFPGYTTSREDAIKQAEAMRLKKIKNLEAQLDKLREMTFAEPTP